MVLIRRPIKCDSAFSVTASIREAARHIASIATVRRSESQLDASRASHSAPTPRRAKSHRGGAWGAGRQDRVEPADERDAGGDGAGAVPELVRGFRPRPRQTRRPPPRRPRPRHRRPLPRALGRLRPLGHIPKGWTVAARRRRHRARLDGGSVQPGDIATETLRHRLQFCHAATLPSVSEGSPTRQRRQVNIHRHAELAAARQAQPAHRTQLAVGLTLRVGSVCSTESCSRRSQPKCRASTSRGSPSFTLASTARSITEITGRALSGTTIHARTCSDIRFASRRAAAELIAAFTRHREADVRPHQPPTSTNPAPSPPCATRCCRSC